MTFRTAAIALAAAALGLTAGAVSHAQTPKPAAAFTADGKLGFPKDYRTWVYLSSGLDMSYVENMNMGEQHTFDNVFVDPAAYAAFLQTGHWPEGSVFVLEVRRGENKGSINKKGAFQTQRLAVEVHVKDKGFKSGWAFFGFNGEGPAQALPQTSQCNQCHEAHGAVDTTFVQFYPTLLPRAQELKTLSAAYLAEEKGAVK
jgi:cytochrome P460